MSDKAGERPRKLIHFSPTQSWAPFNLAKPPGSVIPAAPQEFGDLHIELGDRQILAFLNDHSDPTDAVWARLIETIGPFPENSATDRILADFSIHGSFERNVTRRSGQVWVQIRVRSADIATAFLDLDNVATILAEALTEATRGTHDQH